MKSMLVLCVFLVIGAIQAARIRRQAAAPATTAKADGMDVALGFMDDELKKESDLGGPVNPGGLQKASDMTGKIQSLGDAPTMDKFADLMAAGADPPKYGPGAAAKPADTKVNLSQFGA